MKQGPTNSTKERPGFSKMLHVKYKNKYSNKFWNKINQILWSRNILYYFFVSNYIS